MTTHDYAAQLSSLGYPGFSYVKEKTAPNPARFSAYALNEGNLDSRIVEGLPWVVLTNPEMDWEWLRSRVGEHRRQNRLGFIAALAIQLAERERDSTRAAKLGGQLDKLELILLAEESTLCHDVITTSEGEWLREHRSTTAAHWHILSDVKSEGL